MTQKIILDKFIRYLDITSSQDIAQLKEQKLDHVDQYIREQEDFIQKFKVKLEAGHCFGLSVCHGAMDHIGKLNWWEHVLVELNNWNELNDSLDTEIIIPDSTDNKPTTRRKLFELAIDYIVSSQAERDAIEEFIPESTDQESILKPDSRITDLYKDQDEQKQLYFEIIDDNDEIKTIKKHKVIAGYFTVENLESILSEENFKDTICLINSGDHSIRLKYAGDNQWVLYDPNYSHQSVKSMHFKGNKHNVLNEAFRRLKTHSISIEFATFNPEANLDFPAYDEIIQNSPENLLRKEGLHFLAESKPELLPKLFQLANDDKKGLKVRAEIFKSLTEYDAKSTGLHFIIHNSPKSLPALFKLADDSEQGLKLRSAIAKGLTGKLSKNRTGLQIMAITAPAHFPLLFNLIDKTTEGLEIRNAIVKALTEKSKEGDSGMNYLARFAPHSLIFILFKMAIELSKKEEILTAFTKEISEKNTNKEHGWMEMIIKDGLLPRLLQLADNNTEARLALAEMLIEKPKYHTNGLHAIALHSQGDFQKMLGFAEQYPEMMSAIIKGISVEFANRNNTWMSFIAQSKSLTRLLQIADQTPKGLELRSVIARLLTHKTSDNRTGLNWVADFSPESLPQLFELAHDNQEIRSAIAKCLSEKFNDKNYTWFSFLAINNLLPSLFKLAHDTSQGLKIKSALTKMLGEKNNNMGSGMQFLLQYAPNLLPDLLKLIDDTPSGKKLQSAIAASLANQNRDNASGLDYLVKRCSGSIGLTINAVIQGNNATAVSDILKAFSTINSEELTGWQTIDKYATPSSQKENILNDLLIAISELDTNNLIRIGNNVSDALTDDRSVYHGLCKERNSFFRRDYGKTNIWQKMVEKVQETLKKRSDYIPDNTTEKLLNVSTSRWG